MERNGKTNKAKSGGRGAADRRPSSSETSSNIVAELFGPEEPAPADPNSIASLFSHPSAGGGGRGSPGAAPWRQREHGDGQYGGPGAESESGERGRQEGSIFENVGSQGSNYFSSSIYYGGRETYPTTQPTPPRPPQGEGEDDGKATRGNWWQGSLYY